MAENNSEAIRRPGAENVLSSPVAETVARAVGFRNVLVHEYIDIDNHRVVESLERLADLEAFVREVAAWLDGS